MNGAVAVLYLSIAPVDRGGRYWRYPRRDSSPRNLGDWLFEISEAGHVKRSVSKDRT